ncbi:bifunctional serine/threonine-protein kinase/formylglycine-generating enzyme family protein [Myxococcus faecalis]|uniref:bifunctional serine/threonine-protein kinase/formylglycine-generating enzyme family protein n=1 Tax=Myxococcus faecalis TaxID=3115646 RepID=UPI003CF150BE
MNPSSRVADTRDMARGPELALLTESEGILEVDSVVDGFRILKPLGEGAMGQVFLAQDLSLGRRVALKFLKVELLGQQNAERLLEEARTTARFNHPHIITVHGVGKHHGRPYLALEYIDGESLRHRLTHEPPGPNEALRICRAIAEATAEAHRHGIIHADLKPENVLLPRDGRVRVVDFGLARHAGTEQGAASGTPAYMAPERWHGAPPSPAIDVWSLGIIAFELLEGRRPLTDEQLASFVFSPWPLEHSPRELALPVGQLLRACLAIAPAHRPSAQQVAQALAEALGPGHSRAGDLTPFRGLHPFTEGDAEDFFGREPELDAFIERLRHEPLVPLVGPSGIGKSSFLHAGVIPRLRQMDRWSVLVTRPGPNPLGRLAAMLVAGLEDEATAEATREVLARRPGEGVRLLRRRGEVTQTRVLLAFDAFEEVFTLAAPQERLQFTTCLAAIAAADDRWRVVLVLRDDYLGAYCSQEPLRPHLGAAFMLARLGPAALHEAISGPLRRVGYSTDDASLVPRLVAEVQELAAGLPLLQFACMALWEQRDTKRRLLLASVHEALGGVGGALASHAQRLLRQLPTEEFHKARALLLRLVTAAGTRRPRPQTELLEGLGAEGARVLERLLTNRLVTVTREPQTDEPFIELAHESLVLAWPDLTRWLEETHEERVLVQQLEQASQLWEQRGRQVGETWTDEALSQALWRVAEWDVRLPTRSREFLEAGRQRARSLTRRRRWMLGGYVAALALIALVSLLAAWAFREKQLEAIRRQDDIRLAAANMGEFELVLEPHDFDPVKQQWTRAADMDLDWTLRPADETSSPEEARPYSPQELLRSRLRRMPDGSLRERVEAPSRMSWLIVERPGCAPSIVRLRQLPDFDDRQRGPPRELRFPIPTCAASKVDSIPIPAGPYWKPESEDSPEPEHLVEVADFSLDRTEVTNGQFRLFESQILPQTFERREHPPKLPIFSRMLEPAMPVTGVDAADAQAFCRYMGKQLPTEDEWRKAFRGGLTLGPGATEVNPAPRRRTVWMVERREPQANLSGDDGHSAAAPVGSFPEDRSPYGLLDMAGNVGEWTRSISTRGENEGLRISTGGRWDSPLEERHDDVAWSTHLPSRRFDFALGLRCAEHP